MGGAGWATRVPPGRANSKCKGPGAGAMNALCVQGEHGGQKGEARVSSLEREDLGVLGEELQALAWTFQSCGPAQVRRDCGGPRLEDGDAAQEGDSGGRGQHLPPGLGAVLGCMVSPQFMSTGDLRM